MEIFVEALDADLERGMSNCNQQRPYSQKTFGGSLMASKIDLLKSDLKALLEQGHLILYGLQNSFGLLPDTTMKTLNKKENDLPFFHDDYELWYSESLYIVKQIIPDRVNDFVFQYHSPKRKEIDKDNYSTYDYLRGITLTKTATGETLIDGSEAIPKMRTQLNILRSAANRFSSSLFDIREVLQAEVFDSELEAAAELNKKGFYRGAGAMVGVVLERHLSHVCTQHNLKIRKQKPTIGELNDLLKDNVIDTATWRSIQYLGDLRNLCDHKREREPTEDDVRSLIEGTDKIIKTVF